MDIDELVTRSAPPTAERTPELTEALRLLAADAEAQARPARRARRAAGLLGATAAIVGLGAAGATAAGFVPGWVPWTTGEGSSCTMKFGAKPHDRFGDPLDYTYGKPLEGGSAELRRAVDEANRFLATFDLDAIDEARAIKEFQQGEDAAIAAMPPAEQQPRLTGDDLALNAVWLTVSGELDAHLASLGLPSSGEALSVWMAWECE